MNINQEITVALPDWLKHNTGKITKIIQTPTENYYVIEFPGGEMYTYKESDLTPTNESIKRYHRTRVCCSDRTTAHWKGYIHALWREHLITWEEWDTLCDELDEE